MRKRLALMAAGALIVTGCSQPREETSVEVSPPPVVEVPTQTVFHQAIKSVMDPEAIIMVGVPALESLKNAAAEIEQYAPEPQECAGTVDADFYTTNDVAVGFHSKTAENSHTAQTVVAAGFDNADDATAYFTARTEPWTQCDNVDLTIDETNVLTLHYQATGLGEVEEITIPDVLTQADQELVLTSRGELSGAFETSDTAIPDAGSLPDYVISPNDVPEPEAENISITNATVVARFDTQVFWTTVEPGQQLDEAVATLAEVVEAVQAQQ